MCCKGVGAGVLQDWDHFFSKSHGNSGIGSAFCGYTSRSGKNFHGRLTGDNHFCRRHSPATTI